MFTKPYQPNDYEKYFFSILFLFVSLETLGQYKEHKALMEGKIPLYMVYAHKAATSGVEVRNIILNPHLYNLDSLYILNKPEMHNSKPITDSTIIFAKVFMKKHVELITYDEFLKIRKISKADARLPTYLNNNRLYDLYNSLVYNDDVSEVVIKEGRLLIFKKSSCGQ